MSNAERFLIMEALARGKTVSWCVRKFNRGSRTIERIRDAQPVHDA